MYSTVTGSSRTVAPSRVSTRSSSAFWVSQPNLYEKPEQPPLSTLTRNMAPGASLLARSLIRFAAFSVNEGEAGVAAGVSTTKVSVEVVIAFRRLSLHPQKLGMGWDAVNGRGCRWRLF